jgi:hypothetical protein
MAYEMSVSMAVLLAGTGFVLARRSRVPRIAGLDRELADLLDRDAVDVLRAELAREPMFIALHTETTLRGPILRFDVGDRRFRMRLYGESSLVEDGEEQTTRMPRGSTALLTAIEDLRSSGWLVVLQTESGRRRYPGWQIERVLDRRPLTVARTP